MLSEKSDIFSNRNEIAAENCDSNLKLQRLPKWKALYSEMYLIF